MKIKLIGNLKKLPIEIWNPNSETNVKVVKNK